MKVVAEGANQVNGLLEAQTVETNDIDRIQGAVGAHQQASPSGGVNHRDEGYELPAGLQQQITYPVLNGDVLFAVYGADG